MAPLNQNDQTFFLIRHICAYYCIVYHIARTLVNGWAYDMDPNLYGHLRLFQNLGLCRTMYKNGFVMVSEFFESEISNKALQFIKIETAAATNGNNWSL